MKIFLSTFYNITKNIIFFYVENISEYRFFLFCFEHRLATKRFFINVLQSVLDLLLHLGTYCDFLYLPRLFFYIIHNYSTIHNI